MSLKEEDKKTIIQYRINRALETIDEVDFLLNNKKLSLAVSRIYYGCYYILTALALFIEMKTFINKIRVTIQHKNKKK